MVFRWCWLMESFPKVFPMCRVSFLPPIDSWWLTLREAMVFGLRISQHHGKMMDMRIRQGNGLLQRRPLEQPALEQSGPAGPKAKRWRSQIEIGH